MPDADGTPGPDDLRWLADTYEQSQRVRIAAGERIRALVQQRDRGLVADADAGADAESVLSGIRAGHTDGPVPLLGRTYRVHWNEERELRAGMEQALAPHPAWPWLAQVRGFGPTLACKLLARLDLDRAPTPSSFWAYCGLATVPAPDGVGRIAQRLTRGQRASYDRYAKKVCYQIAVSFLRSGGPYADYYRNERARLRRDRPAWSRAHVHLAALRKTEKLFLSHLWQVWAAAVGRPVVPPYSEAVLMRTARIEPPGLELVAAGD